MCYWQRLAVATSVEIRNTYQSMYQNEVMYRKARLRGRERRGKAAGRDGEGGNRGTGTTRIILFVYGAVVSRFFTVMAAAAWQISAPWFLQIVQAVIHQLHTSISLSSFFDPPCETLKRQKREKEKDEREKKGWEVLTYGNKFVSNSIANQR